MLADKEFLESLLAHIGKKLNHETECMIIGGNAMLYYDLRGQTKDLDMVFFKQQDIAAFVKIIKNHPLYKKIPSSKTIPYYVRPDLSKKGKPIFIGNDDVPRFDLFYKNVFSVDATPIFKDSERTIIFDMLRIRLPKPEYIIFLKAAADRPQDREDIARLVKNLPIDWKKFLDIANQYSKESERAVYFALESLHDINQKNKTIPKNVLESLAKIFGMKM